MDSKLSVIYLDDVFVRIMRGATAFLRMKTI